MADRQTITYDLCIVGAGMIGSAAARHASESQSVRVCLIGPEEPTGRSEATLFGAHYDEGRVTRRTDRDPFWAMAATSSIQRYREIEQKSGIGFYTECGSITVGPNADPNFMDRVKASATDLNFCEVLTAPEARVKFPYVHIDDEQKVVHESKCAGYINPRAMVAAQKEVARQQGCYVLNDVVDNVSDSSQSHDPVLVRCHSGLVISTHKVMLATGAFTDFRKLLPRGLSPDVCLASQAILLAQVPDSMIEHASDMPAVIYRAVTDTDRQGAEASFGSYSTPPIKYPDGKYYLKIGHGQDVERTLTTEAEVVEWYRSDTPQQLKDALWTLFKQVYPKVKPVSVQFDTCVTTSTSTRLPFIDLLTPRLCVALGGNGYAAKSCDELGRISAELVVNNKWDIPFNRDIMKMRYKHQGKL